MGDRQYRDWPSEFPPVPWLLLLPSWNQISLVASVVSIQTQATNCVYVLDDGSGRIEARHWIDANEESGNKFEGIE